MANSSSKDRSIGYWSVVAIGVGGMVGGGIFAVLGLAVQLAHGGTPVAFLLAGIIALITSYSYAKLSIKYPSQGGTVEFLNKAFGEGIITGGLNILLLLSYIVMLSLYAYAFGSYANTFFKTENPLLWKHIFISSIILILTGLNILSAKVVGKTEELIVGFKISILLLFIGVGLWSVKINKLEPSTWTGPAKLIAGGMIIFLAYEGFELIANTAENVKNPEKTLPKAYYSAVIFVILLYILISIVTVGNLSIKEILNARDYALAESAKPFLGNKGFILIAVAALLSTASAINATLYGASRISYIIAKDGELPEILEEKIWNKPIEGLILTSVLTLVIANFFDLSNIAMMGSAGFLIIFAAVNIANIKLYKMTNSKKIISLTGAILCISALLILTHQTAINSPDSLYILAVMILISFLIEIIYRKFTGRKIKSLTLKE